ncbi:MAG: tRNA (adenosine(37)-N6)-threonylcarbamoyltransferase complex dimerization subunit type 1 TsaB [bacterium]
MATAKSTLQNPERLPILAIETSGGLCSVALLLAPGDIVETKIMMKHIHSEKLFPVIDSILNLCSLKLELVREIAVSAGPGSFTGLRIGMSAAKGLAMGLNIPITAVPTFEAMALQICTFINHGEEFLIANSVNREELYFMKFKKENDFYKIIEELELVKKEDFDQRKGDTNLLFGDFARKNSFLNFNAPDAEYVAKWSYIFGDNFLSLKYDYLEPNYLKKFIIKEKK